MNVSKIMKEAIDSVMNPKMEMKTPKAKAFSKAVQKHCSKASSQYGFKNRDKMIQSIQTALVEVFGYSDSLYIEDEVKERDMLIVIASFEEYNFSVAFYDGGGADLEWN